MEVGDDGAAMLPGNRKPPPPNETPVEREIRRAAERERSLRLSRGLAAGAAEEALVEIPLKGPLLSRTLPGRAACCSGGNSERDRQCAGEKMRREIGLEVQREQTLVRLGRVPGGYSRGTVRQLRERRLLFEAFQLGGRPAAATAGSSPTLSSSSSSSSYTYSMPQKTSELGESLTHNQCQNQNQNGKQGLDSLLSWDTKEASLQPPVKPFPAKDNGMGVSLGAHAPLPTPAPAPTREPRREERSRGGEDEESESVMAQKNPFFKLRPSQSHWSRVQKEIREAKEREKELQRLRDRLYGGAGTPRPIP